VNIKIAGKWMFIPLKMVLIGIDPYPYRHDSKAIYHIYVDININLALESGEQNLANWYVVGL
jgi:hypothetical protein